MIMISTGAFNSVRFLLHVIRMFDWDRRILVALNHQQWRAVFPQVVNRTDFPITGQLIRRPRIRSENAGGKSVSEVGSIIVIEQVCLFKVTRAIPGNASNHSVRDFGKELHLPAVVQPMPAGASVLCGRLQSPPSHKCAWGQSPTIHCSLPDSE